MYYFELLKQKIASTFRQSRPEFDRPVEEWKGKAIEGFQEELSEKVQGRISRKWFYTHMKAAGEGKLPRIDMLNLLSRYVGFADWAAFTDAQPPPTNLQRQIRKSKKTGLVIAGSAALILLVWGWMATRQDVLYQPHGYLFCFVDADKKVAVPVAVELTLLPPGESPITVSVDSGACYEWDKGKGALRFAVKARYYKNDTIVRTLSQVTGREEILLRTDDYALMIHLFSKTDISDWEKRRKQLGEMIAGHARIFQVGTRDGAGMEMYNKTEFIDKLTTPLESLKHIEVLETEYEDGKIVGLRFVQE